jgi:hypothetical protein
MVNSISVKYSNEAMLQRAFYRIAWNIWHMWEENGCADTRLFTEPLIPNKFVIVGQSKCGNTHKEHVVPRVIIKDRCLEMFNEGKSIEAVANFVRKFLKIILISEEEQHRLDKKIHGHNLRQSMPDGWTFGNGCEFARLKKVGIEYYLYP